MQKTKHVIVEVSATDYTRRERDPDDRWDNGEHGLTNIGVTVDVARNEREREWAWEVRPAADGSVCVLVEHYGDGDTFGSYERVETKGVYTDESSAREAAKGLHIDHGYFGRHIDFLYFTVKL